MLRWFVAVELAGLAWFVLAAPLFRRWPDRGFGVSKTAGLLALALVVWLSASAGIAALSGNFVLGVLAVLAVLALVAARRRAGTDLRGISWRGVAAGELIYAGAFVAVALLRSASPAALGAEKLMDAALLSALMRAEALPPPDPWLAGHPVNYYYFGALTWAMLAKAVHVPAGVAYNLALTTIGAQLAASSFSIGLWLSRRVWAAAAGAVVFVAGGNPAAALQAWPGAWVGYDMRAPTLVIEGAITEFPAFSLAWGDLHAHLMAAPTVLLSAAGLLMLARAARAGLETHVLALVCGVSVGLAWITSTWDLPMLLWLGVLACLGLASARPGALRSPRWACASAAGVGIAGAAACATPFLRHFESPGFRVIAAPFNTAIGALLLAQGFVLILLAAVLIGTARRRPARSGASGSIEAAPSGGWKAWAPPLVLCALTTIAAGLAMRSVSVVLLAALWTGLAVAWWRHPRASPVLLGLVVATALLIPELFVVVEPYGSPFERVNTVFKLHWHATILAGPLWAWTLARIMRGAGRGRRLGLMGLAAVLVASALVYPAALSAIRARHAERPLTLDAIAYLDGHAPGDAAIVRFLNSAVAGQPGIVEATTFQYGYAGRISAYTGLPTVIGWSGHERLWRRSARWQAEIAERERAVHAIYNGPIEEARAWLSQYRVRYIVIGRAERQQYPLIDPRRFDAVGTRVLDRGGAAVYEIASEAPPQAVEPAGRQRGAPR